VFGWYKKGEDGKMRRKKGEEIKIIYCFVGNKMVGVRIFHMGPPTNWFLPNQGENVHEQ
jgi:hypothetical protein